MRQALGVAALSAREAVRSRVAVVVVLAMVAGVAALAWGAHGDGSPPGRLRAFSSWACGWEVLLLSLSAAFLSTGLARGLREGRLTLLLTGPLPRWRLLAAWWVGVTGVLAFAAALGAIALGAASLAIAWTAPAPARAAVSDVLQARGRARAPWPDEEEVQAVARSQLEEVLASGRAPEGLDVEAAVADLADRERLRRWSVLPGRALSWDLEGVRPDDPQGTMLLRFRYLPQAEPGALPPGRGPLGKFAFVPLDGGQGYVESSPGRWSGSEFHELPVPVAVLRGGDRVRVVYQNLEQKPVVVVFTKPGVELLYPAGDYVPNLIRAALVLVGRLAFLAALGVVAAALLEGKLATLLVLFVLGVGAAHGFLEDALRPVVFGVADVPLKAVVRAVLWVVPDLSEPDLPARLAGSELVSWREVARVVLLDGGVRGGLLLLSGAILFQRRELGALR